MFGLFKRKKKEQHSVCECGRVDGCHKNPKSALLDLKPYWGKKGKMYKLVLNWDKANKCVRFRNNLKEQFEASDRIVEKFKKHKNLYK